MQTSSHWKATLLHFLALLGKKIRVTLFVEHNVKGNQGEGGGHEGATLSKWFANNSSRSGLANNLLLNIILGWSLITCPSACCGWPTPWDPTGRHGNQHCSLCERLQPAHLRFQGGSTTSYKNYRQCRPKLQSHYTPPHKCLLFEAGEKVNGGKSLTLMLTGGWCSKRCSISRQRGHRLHHQKTSLRDRKDQIRGSAFANGGPAGDMQTAHRHSS